jgi:ATP adenylyltransferase
MTWTLLHDRMGFMTELIQAAETDPEAALDLADRASEVSRLFGGEEGLLLSLRQRWMTMLVAKLDQAAYDDVPAEQARADLAAAQPGLHALVEVAARRSLRVRWLSSGEHMAMDLFGASASDRQTVA